MAELTIGQLAARVGLSASAIRYYEGEGLLPVPRRRSGRRVYHGAAVEQLGLIGLAKRAGFTVAEIRTLVAGFSRRTPPGERWRALTRAKLKELDERIAQAERMKRALRVIARCHCPTLEDCGRALGSKGTAASRRL